MAIINPSLYSNAKWTHLTQTKTAAIAAEYKMSNLKNLILKVVIVIISII